MEGVRKVRHSLFILRCSKMNKMQGVENVMRSPDSIIRMTFAGI